MMASASISMSRRGSMSARTSIIEAAGRIVAKASLWARPISSERVMSVTHLARHAWPDAASIARHGIRQMGDDRVRGARLRTICVEAELARGNIAQARADADELAALTIAPAPPSCAHVPNSHAAGSPRQPARAQQQQPRTRQASTCWPTTAGP
jgi:hypothetical protein